MSSLTRAACAAFLRGKPSLDHLISGPCCRGPPEPFGCLDSDFGGTVGRKRGNGAGSVYRRNDGRVVGEYEDANGKRRYVSGKTKAEVRRKLQKCALSPISRRPERFPGSWFGLIAA